MQLLISMNNTKIIRMLSPLLFFVIHVIYLVVWSDDPFLKKWIDGSFTFFIALVMCNIIRARIAAKADTGDDAGADREGPEGGGQP